MKAVQLHYTPNNNHGCRGFRVTVLPISDKEGKAIGGSSCSSCWQVGHSYNESPVQEGKLVRLPAGYTWEQAEKEDKNFLRTDISLAGASMVRPSELQIMPNKGE